LRTIAPVRPRVSQPPGSPPAAGRRAGRSSWSHRPHDGIGGRGTPPGVHARHRIMDEHDVGVGLSGRLRSRSPGRRTAQSFPTTVIGWAAWADYARSELVNLSRRPERPKTARCVTVPVNHRVRIFLGSPRSATGVTPSRSAPRCGAAPPTAAQVPGPPGGNNWPAALSVPLLTTPGWPRYCAGGSPVRHEPARPRRGTSGHGRLGAPQQRGNSCRFASGWTAQHAVPIRPGHFVDRVCPVSSRRIYTGESPSASRLTLLNASIPASVWAACRRPAEHPRQGSVKMKGIWWRPAGQTPMSAPR